MFVLGNLCYALAHIIDKVIWLYSIVVLIAVLITWVRPDPFHPIIQFLRAATEPLFNWVREKLPFAMVGMLDLSPVIVLLGLQLVQMVVVRSLIDLAVRLR
jgi:YggT family protein